MRCRQTSILRDFPLKQPSVLTVTSQAKQQPPCHGTSVSPSRRLSSPGSKPDGSLVQLSLDRSIINWFVLYWLGGDVMFPSALVQLSLDRSIKNWFVLYSLGGAQVINELVEIIKESLPFIVSTKQRHLTNQPQNVIEWHSKMNWNEAFVGHKLSGRWYTRIYNNRWLQGTLEAS